jgi:putative sigma-54 modulation protein
VYCGCMAAGYFYRRKKMNTEIKSLRFNLQEDTKEYLNKKIERIHNAENMIVDLLVTLKKDKDFEAEATVNFRWGVSIHVKESDFELQTAIDKMMDKLIAKITKEKEKVKEKR